MRTSLITASVATALLILSGCSGEQTGAENPSSQSSQESPSTQSKRSTAQSESQSDTERNSRSRDQHDSQPKSDEAKKSDADPSSHARNSVTVSTGSKKVTIEPTDVYCSGRPGHIHHIIGKTDNGLPLVKAQETHFAMAKIGHGRPYKAGDPTGVKYSKNSVTFDDTSLGSATMNGTMTCTAWED